jgi:FkbM family methyltransferase
MSKFSNRVYRLLEQQFGLVSRRTTTFPILDRPYQVIAGSARTDDYDDAWLLALGMRSKTVLDVGCNTGQAALLLLYSASITDITLIDPNPAALAIAAENLIRNNLSHRARFVRAFISDQDDSELRFFTVGSGAAGSLYSSHAVTAAREGSSSMVSTLTLDTFAKSLPKQPDLVKIDVEGAERLVLKGAKNLARAGVTRFMVEMHSNPELLMRANAEAVLAWCKEVNYRAWYLKEKIELTNAQQIEKRGRCHLLLLPENSLFPDFLRNLEQGAPLERVASV